MPVAVACSCGAKLRVPDTAAGKRVKCPKCGSPVSVPAAVAEYEEVDDEPAPPPVAKKKPMLVDDDEPTPVKRPSAAAKKKAEPVEVDEAVDDDDTPKKKRRRDDDDDEDDDDTPKKKGKKGKGKKGKKGEAKSNLPLLLGIGGGVFVLLTIVGIVVGVMMSGGGGSAKGTTAAPPTQPALPTGWTTFKGEGFSVAVPDAIQFKEQQQGAGPGQPPAGTKTYTNGVQPQPQPNGPPFFIYLVSVGDVPPAVAAEFAKSPAAGYEALKKLGGGGANLENEKVVQVGGLEGRQYTLNVGFAAGVARVVVKGNKGYSLVVMSQAAPAEDAAEVKPFFDTFKFE